MIFPGVSYSRLEFGKFGKKGAKPFFKIELPLQGVIQAILKYTFITHATGIEVSKGKGGGEL